MNERRATVQRSTRETEVAVTLDLDGDGHARVVTGVGFLDHMLTLFAHHGCLSLDVTAKGDVEVDAHHTVEDVALMLGAALKEALGEKRGVHRYGSVVLPMDEALVMAALDLSGSPFYADDLHLSGVRLGAFDGELASHFFQSLAMQAGLTLHVRLLAGSNAHHIVEAVFKAVARALAQACARDGDTAGEVPSTKGSL
jgi:imidazoleglycerol-phosphate dehydratase